jgi:DNA-binding XRE family transcriptional regulator
MNDVETPFCVLRKRAGYTQEKAAHRFGVSARTWGAWERGETQPPRAVWDLLAIEAAEAATSKGVAR